MQPASRTSAALFSVYNKCWSKHYRCLVRRETLAQSDIPASFWRITQSLPPKKKNWCYRKLKFREDAGFASLSVKSAKLLCVLWPETRLISLSVYNFIVMNSPLFLENRVGNWKIKWETHWFSIQLYFPVFFWGIHLSIQLYFPKTAVVVSGK